MENDGILSEKNLKKIKKIIVRELIDKGLYITAAVDVARSITSFAYNKSPLSFIEGSFAALGTIAAAFGTSSSDLFNPSQGWEPLIGLFNQRYIFDIISPVIEKFPYKCLHFKFDNYGSSKIFELPNGKTIGKDDVGYWFLKEDWTRKEILDFLFDELFKSLNSNIFSIHQTYARDNRGDFVVYSIKPEQITSLQSPTATKHLNHIKQAIDKNINRSVIFIGNPGSGKTSIANTIISELKLRTLKFKFTPETDLNAIEELISELKVEAIVIDDLDTIEGLTNLLEFLEKMHSKLKLMIGIVNSLENIHPALVRPFRFDEIIAVKNIDASIIKLILGARYNALYPKVKNWPVAFIRELNERININPKVNINQQIKELDKRVKDQAEAFKPQPAIIFQ